jgi:threonine synthase
MRYISTRGAAPELGFDDVLLAGLASDGGLYVPESIPKLETIPDASAGYAAVAAEVMRPFVGDGVVADRLDELCAEAYGGFAHPQVAPLTEVADDLYLLELFWGPTLSFKDYALQLVGRMFDAVLADRGEHVLVLGATSGDTGSAAIAGCEGREAIDVVILYPEGRVSDFQRRQMTTVEAANVRAVSVDGTFDDCQDLVKAAFGDERMRTRYSLAAVNSINWARVMAQTAYYWWTAANLDRPFSAAVPTGNFGNVLAAWVARQMGAPIDRLIVGNNANHGLATLISTGRLPLQAVSASLAPAMDIAVPSNLERYLFELFDRSPQRTAEALGLFRSQGELILDEMAHGEMASVFTSGWVDDPGIEETMGRVAGDFGLVIDPHTAVGWEVGVRLRRPSETLVIVSTAHPAKFSEAVVDATGDEPQVPSRAAHVLDLPERMSRLRPDLSELDSLLREMAGSSGF